MIEWKFSNEQLEKSIIEQQEINKQLMQNLNEWQQSNKSIEYQFSEMQELKFEPKNANNDAFILNEITENLINAQKCLIMKQEEENNKSVSKYEKLLSLKELLIEKLEEEILKKNLSGNISLMEKNIIYLQQLNQDLTTNLVEWQTSNKNIENLILDEQDLNNKLTFNFSKWKETNNLIQNEYDKTIEINTLKKEFLSKDQEIKEEIEKINDLKNELNNQVNEQKKDIIQKEKEISFLKKEFDDLKALNTELSKKNYITDLELQEYKLTIKKQKTDIDDKNDKLSKFSNLENEKTNYESELSSAQSLNLKLEENLSEWSNTNKNLELMILNEQELNTQLLWVEFYFFPFSQD